MSIRLLAVALGCFVALALLQYLYLRFYSGLAKEKEGRIVFRPLLPIRLVTWCAVALGLPLSVIVARNINWQREWWTVTIIAAAVLASIVLRPYTIVIDDLGVSTHRYLIRMRAIEWSRVTEVRQDAKRSTVTIVSSDGQSIKHHNIHEDQARFAAEAESRARCEGH